jgi:hypothetical protein
MTDPVTSARDAILDSIGEDEYGTWELLAAVRTALPDLEEDELRTTARQAFAGLEADGLVELWRGRALQGGPTERADVSALDAPGAWEPAGEEPSYLTAAITPAGEEAYYALLRRQAEG